MRYLAAYMLCQLGGKEHPTAADIRNVLSSVGIEHEDSRLDLLLKEVSGKETAKLIEEGRCKMASVNMGGGVAGGGAVAASTTVESATTKEAPAAAKAPAKEEKKEESEDSDADLGLGLFD
ncbi:Ribosomal protein large P2 [Fasciolopsis buskii]|uniref:Large ribosomal subunit protein P2 n=1 Tax=Fasciolopsis buskii TaxID=27845 RepID=A0A8E0VIU0_9TREM|nr:Ribosomal protein large P2 [Fasciolopsis buski]